MIMMLYMIYIVIVLIAGSIGAIKNADAYLVIGAIVVALNVISRAIDANRKKED